MSETTRQSIPPSYFEAKYQADIDPWEFRTSAYEKDKYQATLAALSKPKFKSALEVGCAIGVFSALLAPRCEHLVAVDGSAIAIEEATRQKLPNVEFQKAFLPNEFPGGAFDLIVLSEVLYFFSILDLKRLAAKCLRAMEPGGEMILCHWLGKTNYPLTGQDAGELFIDAMATHHQPKRIRLHEGIYRLERLYFPPVGEYDAE